MKDIFNSYQKQKALSHLGILAISGVLAVSVNMFILGGPNGDVLKANINEFQTSSEIVEDIILYQDDTTIGMQANQQMDNVEQISFSFAYDSENLAFLDAISDIDGVEITKIETNPGFSSFILVFQSPILISENTEIVTVDYTRGSEKTVYLNPINFNFTDTSGTNYSLTASSLIF